MKFWKSTILSTVLPLAPDQCCDMFLNFFDKIDVIPPCPRLNVERKTKVAHKIDVIPSWPFEACWSKIPTLNRGQGGKTAYISCKNCNIQNLVELIAAELNAVFLPTRLVPPLLGRATRWTCNTLHEILKTWSCWKRLVVPKSCKPGPCLACCTTAFVVFCTFVYW